MAHLVTDAWGKSICKSCGRRCVPADIDWHRCPTPYMVTKRRKQAKTAVRNREEKEERLRMKHIRVSLTPKEKMIRARKVAALRLISNQGMTAICQNLNLGERTYTRIISSPEYARAVAELEASDASKQKEIFDAVQGRMLEAEIRAGNKINEVLSQEITDKTIATIAKTSKDVLEMRGHSAPKKLETEVTITLSDETLRLMRTAKAEIEARAMKTIPLEESDWSYALTKTRADVAKQEVAQAPRIAIEDRTEGGDL